MRPTHLHQIAWGSLLANAELGKKLLSSLADPASLELVTANGDALQTLRTLCQTHVASTMVARWPRRFRLNEVDLSARQLCGSDLFSSPHLHPLEEACDRLLVRDGDQLHYRKRQVHTYAALASELDPQLLAAWHLSDWLHRASDIQEHDVRRIVHAQTPMLVPTGELHRSMADNHVHLNGVAGDDAVMAAVLMAPSVKEASNDKAGLKSLQALRPWLEVVLRLTNPISFEPNATKCAEKIKWHREAKQLHSRPEHRVIFQWGELAITRLGVGDLPWFGLLLQELARAMNERRYAQAGQWLWLLLLYRFRAAATQPIERVVILALISSVMGQRRQLIVDKPGIRYFAKEYFGHPLRKKGLTNEGLKNRKAHWREAARRLLQGADDVAEIKISPSDFKPDTVACFAATAGDWQVQLQRMQVPGSSLSDHSDGSVAEQVRGMERWHFCVHFLRPEQPFDEPSKPGARQTQRKKNWEEAKNLDKKLKSKSEWFSTPFIRQSDALGLRFVPGRWVRGLDVAGDESGWPIEYFAPQLRWLRRGLLPRSAHEPATSGFHLSVHAGEDYSHPLSGMRHVDETVRFCEMRDGDRLGHALALGIPPKDWMERHGEVLIPVEEHLDNLVWAWGYASKLAHRLPLAAQMLPRLERRIGRFAPEVAWVTGAMKGLAWNGISDSGAALASPLWKAWELRRNCAWQLKSDSNWPSSEFQVGVPDHARLRPILGALDRASTDRSVLHLYLFLKRVELEQLSSLTGPIGIRRLVRVSLLTGHSGREDDEKWRPLTDSPPLPDHEDEQDLELMLAFQDYLLNLYATRGLVIEANPTSNLYIARLGSMAQHPIFRWYPPDPAALNVDQPWNAFGLRHGAMPVLVNTDDPGIMPTTLRMEFELLREAALELGYSRHLVETWLENLRQAGLDHFKRNHEPVFGRG